jgi:hypothetical protein
MSSPFSPEAVPATNGRAAGGRFAAGNPGGPGNPFARQTAALRAYLINHVTERDIQDILDILLLNAKGGHLPTIKFLFSYVLGKPQPAVNPDVLDLQEMQLFQQGALPPEALETLSRQLPLPFLLQLLHFCQGVNEVNTVNKAQDASPVDDNPPQADVLATPPQPRADSDAPAAAPSINGDNGASQGAARTKPPSTNGEKKHRPQLYRFDWLRELRPPRGGRSKPRKLGV